MSTVKGKQVFIVTLSINHCILLHRRPTEQLRFFSFFWWVQTASLMLCKTSLQHIKQVFYTFFQLARVLVQNKLLMHHDFSWCGSLFFGFFVCSWCSLWSAAVSHCKVFLCGPHSFLILAVLHWSIVSIYLYASSWSDLILIYFIIACHSNDLEL